MEEITVVNVKCGGCQNTITKTLEKIGCKNISFSGMTIHFEGDRERAKKVLEKKGYPESGSKAAQSLLLKTKSYVSCMQGKF